MTVDFELDKNACLEGFALATQAFCIGFASHLRGYISWMQMVKESNKRLDIIAFETMDELDGFEKIYLARPNEVSQRYFSFIDLSTIDIRKYYDKDEIW